MKAGNLALLFLGAILALCLKETQQTIPTQMFMRMKNLNSTEDFIMHFIRRANRTGQSDSPEIDQYEDELFVQQGANFPDPDGAHLIAGMMSPADTCSPKLTSVPIPGDGDPNIILWPMCVELDQCGGCCGKMLECAPSVIEVQTFTVLRGRYPYAGSPNFEYEGMQDIDMQRHLGCECRCKVQPYHCTDRQEYLPDACRCRCLNEHQSVNCMSPKQWDNQHCACVCPPAQNCLGDEHYSNTTCRCERTEQPNEIPEEDIIVIEPEAPVNDPCADIICRPGFEGVQIGTICRCMVASHSQMEGMLPIRPGQPTTRRPPTRRIVEYSTNEEHALYERVPGHPQYHHVVEEEAAPIRRRRPPAGRRSRQRPTQ